MLLTAAANAYCLISHIEHGVGGVLTFSEKACQLEACAVSIARVCSNRGPPFGSCMHGHQTNSSHTHWFPKIQGKKSLQGRIRS